MDPQTAFVALPRLRPVFGRVRKKIFRRILDLLDARDLLVICAVSRAARGLARAHPWFSSHISLDTANPTDTHLFHLRVASRLSLGGPILSLRLCLFGIFSDRSMRHLKKHAMSLMKDALGVLEGSCVIKGNAYNASFVVPYLQHAAPGLQSLELDFVQWGEMFEEAPSLPLDLLGGIAPALRTLKVKGFKFPPKRILGLGGVRSVELGKPFKEEWMIPKNVFRSCPATTTLRLHWMWAYDPEPGFWDGCQQRALDELVVVGVDCKRPLELWSSPSSRVIQVDASWMSESAYGLLFAGRAPTTLSLASFDDFDHGVDCRITATAPGWKRVLDVVEYTEAAPEANLLPVALSGIVDRVTLLTLDRKFWPMLSEVVPKLPRVRKLVIEIGEHAPHQGRLWWTAPVLLPALRTLELAEGDDWNYDWTESLLDMHAFLTEGLGLAPGGDIELVLNGANVDTSSCAGFFRT